MSLIEQAMTECVIMDKKTVPDGYGDFITEYVEGAKIRCAITLDNSTEARIGTSMGVTNLYTITTRKTTLLEFPMVIKRLTDGKTFRIKSDGEDNKTPTSASLNMRQVSAEEFAI